MSAQDFAADVSARVQALLDKHDRQPPTRAISLARNSMPGWPGCTCRRVSAAWTCRVKRRNW